MSNRISAAESGGIVPAGRPPGQSRLLATLERLLLIEAVALRPTMDQASNLIAAAVAAEKVDTFLYDPAIDSLVAAGTSQTPLGKRQRELGMDRLPLANRGRTVQVYQSGHSYMTGYAEEDPEELVGIKEGLGIRSVIAVPMLVDGERRGVLQVDSTAPDAFTESDLQFLEAVAAWIGAVAHRAELVERIRRDAIEEARSRAAEDLVTVLAHDLGNYLTPLVARLDLLRRRARRDGRERDVHDADAMALALDRLRALIRNLLDVARLEQGIFALECRPLDVVTLVQETAQALRTPMCPVEVEAGDEVQVDADPNRMRQALENLIGNALKHSPEGAPVLVRVAQETRDAGPWVVIAVEDAGPGIPPDLLPRLFRRFAAGPGSSGLGLGLYLAHSIAHAHGGSLTVESKLGRGTTFFLAVPAVPQPA